MNAQDEVRVRHMLDAAHEVVTFATGRTRDDLDTDQMLVRALSMSIGIIGEAAANVSAETRETYPDIPWPQIVGMRNRIIHAYFDINRNILWETVIGNIPDLIIQLDAILPEDEA